MLGGQPLGAIFWHLRRAVARYNGGTYHEARVHTAIHRYDVATVHGLPADGRYVAISNSDTKKLDCARKFMYAQVQGLGSRSSYAMDLGTAWDTIARDVFTWWQLRDTQYPASGMVECPFCGGHGTVSTGGGAPDTCEQCGGLGDSALHRACELFRDQVEGSADADPTMSEEQYLETCETLRRMLEGYLHWWQRGPLDTIRIVGTQLALARPITDPRTGGAFRPQVLLERPAGSDGAWVLARNWARAREAEGRVEIRRASWPWVQVGTLDVLGVDRRSNAAWVIDCKASSQPSRYERGMDVDPQLPGYCWLLEPHMGRLGLSGIAGFMYDVVHTKHQPDPRELKWEPPKLDQLRAMASERGVKPAGSKVQDYLDALGIVPGHGGFSRAQNAGVPSWRYEWALERANIDPAPYADHVQWLAENVDRGLYARPWQRYGEDHRLRYGREVWAKARLMHQLRKAGATADPADPALVLDTSFPRTPVCTAPGGSCAYTDLCAQDDGTGGDREHVPTQRWSDTGPLAQPARQASTEPEIDW